MEVDLIENLYISTKPFSGIKTIFMFQSCKMQLRLHLQFKYFKMFLESMRTYKAYHN